MSVYDAAGMRVAEKVNDVWRFLIYDIGGKLVTEYGGMQATDDGGVKYLLSDWQGSTRAVVSNSGYVQGRMDFTAFGEEIAGGIGQRTVSQGFGNANNPRQKYGLTTRDDATGTDHTWFRKHENRAGRWTSPDPYGGSMSIGDPQSFNRYSYVENDPTNWVDPSGLLMSAGGGGVCYGYDVWRYNYENGVLVSVEYLGFVATYCTSGSNGWSIGSGGSPGAHGSAPAQSGNCGVNPITGKPGISRNPANATGNVRSDGRGGGTFDDSRGRRPHEGLDVAGVLNTTPVVAPFSGTVISSGDAGGRMGQTVIINHDNGMQSQLMHLQAGSLIAPNTRVNAGDQIGVVGNTGKGANLPGMQAHVHWILKDKPGGTRLDPEKVLNSPCPKK